MLGTPWLPVIHQTLLVLEMLCRDEVKHGRSGFIFSPFNPNSTGLGWGWAQQICPSWPCQGLCPIPMGSEGHCCPPVLVQPQELWLLIKSPLLRLSDLLGSSSTAPGGTSKLGFYFISSKFPSH